VPRLQVKIVLTVARLSLRAILTFINGRNFGKLHLDSPAPVEKNLLTSQE